MIAARLVVLDSLGAFLADAYVKVAAEASPDRREITATYKPSLALPDDLRDAAAIHDALIDEIARRRGDEIDRGLSLVGPHRDDVTLMIGSLPAKGYSSHGESWSLALALRLASFELLRGDDADPGLFLDCVFA